MNPTDIAFPNLNLYFENVPKSLTLFNGFSIALYGIIIGSAMIICVMVAAYDRKSRGLDSEVIWDLAIYGIISGVIGARIYYVVFSWSYYSKNPGEILNVRNGGLAIYGGVIAGFLAVFIYSKVKKESFPELFDSVALVFPIGQALGRWGNFFNREAFGDYSDGLFAMRLPIEAVRISDISEKMLSNMGVADYIDVHPAFLYESVWNLLLFIGLFLYRKKKRFSGEIFFLYLFFYGLGRFFIEGLRTDQLRIAGTALPVSRVVAVLCMVIAGVALIGYKRFYGKREG